MIAPNHIQVLDALIGAYSYNMDDDTMILLYCELIDRFKRKNCDWTEEGNIVYSTMVILFGDYGTSPRTGWFNEEEIVKDCIRLLEEEAKTLGGW